jgi:membrane associated rhomboid family serine protease
MYILDPKAIASGQEFWRLLSYIFVPANLQSALLPIAALYIFSTRLESVLNKNIYPVFFLLVVLLQSIVYTLVFWNTNNQLYGLEGIALYSTVLFVLLKPKEKVKFWVLPESTSLVYGMCVLALWTFIKLVSLKNPEYTVATFLYTFSFGTAAAVITYAQLNFIGKMLRRKVNIPPYPKITNIQKDTEEEQPVALASTSKLKKYSSIIKDDFDDEDYILLSDDPEENEERLNRILDKMNDLGPKAISESERSFLRVYSKSLEE